MSGCYDNSSMTDGRHIHSPTLWFIISAENRSGHRPILRVVSQTDLMPSASVLLLAYQHCVMQPHRGSHSRSFWPHRPSMREMCHAHCNWSMATYTVIMFDWLLLPGYLVRRTPSSVEAEELHEYKFAAETLSSLHIRCYNATYVFSECDRIIRW